jgi:hypothetical protein
MNRNRIFYIYQESSNFDTIINKLSKSNYNYNYNNTKQKLKQQQNYNINAKEYLATKAIQFIKFHNKDLEVKEYELFKLPFLPRYLFLIILTKTNTNHPYGLFINLDSNYIYFCIPFGKDRKQADIEDYQFAINNATIPKMALIYILLEKNILIRKKAIITIGGQFNLIDCNNINSCIKKKHELEKKNIPFSEKQSEMNKYNEYYLNKAVKMLKTYFALLDVKNWDEAFMFLKGTQSKYFGKERLNTFFKNTKNIIGHLEIFIAMYQLFFYARDSLYYKLQN